MAHSSQEHTNWRQTAERVLSTAPLFANCSIATRTALMESGRLVRLEKDAVVARQDELPDPPSVIIDGLLAYSRTAANGKRYLIGFLRPGNLVHLVAMLDGQLSVHDVECHEPSLLLQVTHERFDALLMQDPVLNRNVMRLLCRRERALYDWLSGRMLLGLQERCARLLLWLVDDGFGSTTPSAAVPLKLSQEEFAEMLGCTRQAAGKELLVLRREGIIETSYSHLEVRDLDALRRIAMVQPRSRVASEVVGRHRRGDGH